MQLLLDRVATTYPWQSNLNAENKHLIRQKLLTLLDEEDSAVSLVLPQESYRPAPSLTLVFIDCQNLGLLRWKDSPQRL